VRCSYIISTRSLVRGRSSRDRRHNEPDPTVGKAIYTAAIETVRARRADHPAGRVGGRVCVRTSIHIIILYIISSCGRCTDTGICCDRAPGTEVEVTGARGVDPARRRRTKEKVCVWVRACVRHDASVWVYERKYTSVLTPKCTRVCV